jgi:hypothetical protein
MEIIGNKFKVDFLAWKSILNIKSETKKRILDMFS